MAYSDSNLLLKIAYGSSANLPISPADGTLMVTTDDHRMAVKLPNLDTFFIDSPNAYEADHVSGNFSVYINESATANVVYNGSNSRQLYIGNKLIVGNADDATTNIAQNANIDDPYIDLLLQTGDTTWANVGGIQFAAGLGPLTIKGNGTTITFDVPDYPTELPFPGSLKVSTSGNGTTSTDTFHGSAGNAFIISYNNVGAAKLQGNDIDVINWDGNYTSAGALKVSGSNEWTIPAKFLPKEALLDLVVVNQSSNETLEEAAQRADDIQAGDFVQVNPYDSTQQAELFYVMTVEPTVTVRPVTVGNASYAVQAGTTVGSLTIKDKPLGEDASNVVAFNGGTQNLYIQHGLISTNSDSAITKAATTNNNGAYINSIFQLANNERTATVDSSIFIVGDGDIDVTTDSNNTITISYSQPDYLPNENSVTLKTNGIDFWSYNGSAPRVVDFTVSDNGGLTIIPSIAGAGTTRDTMTFVVTPYTGTAPITVSDFVISHNTIDGLVTSGTTKTCGPSQSANRVASTSADMSLTIPQVTVNAYGHVSALENTSYTLSFPITRYLDEGDRIATVLGTDIYCGITWDTF